MDAILKQICRFPATLRFSRSRCAWGIRCAAAAAWVVTIFVATRGDAASFRENEMLEADYGLQSALPKTFGTGEFTLEVRVRLDESFAVGSTRPQNSPAQLRNWSSADPAPYSREDWWYEGNFLLDGHNNAVFWEGTFSLQIYGGGRVRWLFGDGVNAGAGGLWAVQAHPSGATPSLLDDQWHWVGLVRRWAQDGPGAELELWVDGAVIARERSGSRADMSRYWEGFSAFRAGEAGWFWGSEKQVAAGSLDQYEDFKGELGEVRFWSVARAPEDLAAPALEVASDAAGLVGLYRFPEEFGGRVCNSLTGGECVELRVSDRRWKVGGAGFGAQDWAAVAAYASAAALALWCAVKRGRQGPSGRVWLATGAILAVLAVVTWLDLELLVQQVLRRTAQVQGWYGVRQVPQVIGVFVAVGTAYYAIRAATWRAGARDRATPAGLGLCAVLVVLAMSRASSWHVADSILGMGPVQFTLGRLLEVAGASVVSGLALVSQRSEAPPTPDS